MDVKALNNINCGLFVLSAVYEEKQNGCIINTVMQVTASPVKISITVNKDNYTADIILKTGIFNISVLDESVSFDLIKKFGFSSGRENNKFEGFGNYAIAENGVNYITEATNAYMSAKVIDSIDAGTHYIFVAEVTNAAILSDKPSVSYDYYLKNIKPAPKEDKSQKTRWVCKICGYVYEGEELPEDYICPLCKHPASDFEKL